MYLRSVCGDVLYEGRAISIKALVEGAVRGKACLDNVDLKGVNLSYACLDGIEAHNACFWGANLSGTDISDSNLSGADFRNVNLSNSCIARANLSNVDLRGAYFSNTVIDGVNLSRSKFSCPSIFSLDLMDAETLSEAIYSHLGEFEIDLSSLPFVLSGLKSPVIVMKDHVLIGSTMKKIDCYDEIFGCISSLFKKIKTI